jgi:MFS family permease
VAMGLAGSPWVLYLGLLFMGVGSGLVTPAITALVSLYTPADRQGGVLGIFRSAGSFSRVLGPLVGTALFWRFGSAPAYLIGAACILPPLALAFTLPAPGRRRPEAEA